MSEEDKNNQEDELEAFRREIEEREQQGRQYVDGGSLDGGSAEGDEDKKPDNGAGDGDKKPENDTEDGGSSGGNEDQNGGGASDGDLDVDNEPGTSRAYVNVPELDIYGNRKKKSKSAKDDKSHPKPPERYKKSKSDDKEKNIMELFWKEFILASYDWVINTSVDTVLDFLDYILYERKQKNKEEKKEKPDIYSIGKDVRQRTRERILKKKDICNRGFKEIENNLERDKKGLSVEWKMLNSEPSFFKALSSINKKDESQRTHKEKRILEEFFNTPNIMNNMIDEGLKLREISIAAATCECVANCEGGIIISQSFDENFKVLQEAIKNKNPEKVNEASFNMEAEIEGDNPFFNTIREQLTSIREKAKDNQSCKEEVEKIGATVDDCKLCPAFWEKMILKKEQHYFKETEQEKENIASQSPHAVSESFSEKLKKLNEVIADDKTDGSAKKTASIAILDTMEKELSDTSELQKDLKHDVIVMKNIAKISKDDVFVASIEANIVDFNTKYRNNAPIPKEKEEYFKSLIDSVSNLQTSTKEYTTGVKSVFNRDAKKKKMLDNVAKLQNTFTEHKDRKKEPRRPVFNSERICLEIFNNIKSSRG